MARIVKFLPWILALGASCVKVLAVLGTVDGAWTLAREFTWRDRVPFLLADALRKVPFDQREFGPGPTEVALFNVLLVGFTFIQWWAVGWIVRRFFVAVQKGG